jgi:hypothetical protein
MAGVESRRLLPFSDRWGDTDLLWCLTDGTAAESSLGVGLGARLDGMLIPLISDIKSSPRTSSPKPLQTARIVECLLILRSNSTNIHNTEFPLIILQTGRLAYKIFFQEVIYLEYKQTNSVALSPRANYTD